MAYNASPARQRIAVSMGDPNGIGPEILAACLRDGELNERIEILPVGSPPVLEYYLERAGEPLPEVTIEPVHADPEFRLLPGRADTHAGSLAMHSVARAITLCQEGRVEAMTTCPISKEVIARAGFDFPGHTEFIAEKTGSAEVLMMMVADRLRVGLVSAHIPLSQAAQAVTAESVSRTVRLMATSLRQDFGLESPRIAVLGLNPHAGDGGVLGREEIEVITPTIVSLSGVAELTGPFPADGFFGSGAWKHVDGVVAMYHDQGLAPFKALSFGRGVNFSAGLPIVRTSPDHGTGFDIAGSGKADPSSLKAALLLAAEIARKRVNVH
jgi:4-hydroxythreonine-4-phosphate dehydrogenase